MKLTPSESKCDFYLTVKTSQPHFHSHIVCRSDYWPKQHENW